MKKIMCAILASILALSLGACSGGVSQEEYDRVVTENEFLSDALNERMLYAVLAESVATSMGENIVGGRIGENYSCVIVPMTNITEQSLADMYQNILTEAKAVKALLQSDDYDEFTEFSFKVVDSNTIEIFEVTYHTKTDDVDLSIGANYLGQVSAAIMK